MQPKNTRHHHTVYARTLTFLFNGDDVLLIHRPPDAALFPDRYNGVGGHVERGEDILSAARREVHEETGLDVPELILHGVLHVDEGANRPGVIVFIFAGHVQERKLVSSSEGTLHWIPLDQISKLNLMPDLSALLAHVLAAQPREVRPFFASSSIDSDKNNWQVHFSPIDPPSL